MAWVVTKDGIKTEEQLRDEHEADSKINWVCQSGHTFTAPPPHKLQEPPDCPECRGLAKFLSTFPRQARRWT